MNTNPLAPDPQGEPSSELQDEPQSAPQIEEIFAEINDKALSLNEQLQIIIDTENAYKITNKQYSGDCSSLQSYNPQFAYSYAQGDMSPLCQQLKLIKDGQGYQIVITLSTDKIKDQVFTLQVIGAKLLRTCQAAVQLGCNRDQWQQLGYDSAR